MAQTIVQDEITDRHWQPLLSATLVGLGAGLAHWLLGIVLNRYLIEPSACRDISNGLQCANAPLLSGDIAGVVVALLALLVFILIRQARPILIVASAMVLLWGIKLFVHGLSWGFELLAFVGLYGLAYLVFAWINRAVRLPVAIALAVSLVLVGRLLLALE